MNCKCKKSLTVFPPPVKTGHFSAFFPFFLSMVGYERNTRVLRGAKTVKLFYFSGLG